MNGNVPSRSSASLTCGSVMVRGTVKMALMKITARTQPSSAHCPATYVTISLAVSSPTPSVMATTTARMAVMRADDVVSFLVWLLDP